MNRLPFLLLGLIALHPGSGLGGPPVGDDRTERAVARGVQYLLTHQDARGAFPDKWENAYPTGTTALVLYALLKSASADPRVARAVDGGLAFCLAHPLKKVYATSVGIMALEARYARPASQGGPPDLKALRRRWREKSSDAERAWLEKAVAWLLREQGQTYWAYPGGREDLSNGQFAILALAAAERLGIAVPAEPYCRMLTALLATQEAQGPEVADFPVPVADGPLSGRRGREATRERGAPMRARGWGYVPKEGPKGSMTCAGVAALVICKARLERERLWKPELAARVDRALRDGAAWLAREFDVQGHPRTDGSWYYYWLFSLQRAGALSGVEAFGPHYWYENGAAQLLARQEADGRWEWTGKGQRCEAVVDTAFALLFLRRATAGVIERPVSGGSLVVQTTWERRDDGRYEMRFAYASKEPSRSVVVAGSFNEWKTDASPMAPDPAGPPHTYRATLVLPAGRHLYRFLVDGQRWVLDEGNRLRQKDDQGKLSSLLDLP